MIVWGIVAIFVSGMVLWQLGMMTSRNCNPFDSVESVTEFEKSDHFTSTYQESRESFLAAAQNAEGEVHSIQNPMLGPDGEPIFMDVAYFKAANNQGTLVISSGTHGVEGFAGAGIQTGLLKEGIVSRLSPDINLLMIHAINPFGMAHLRRFTEDNVDLNRNFRDYSLPLPNNPEYEKIADAIAPTSLSFASEIASWWKIFWFRITAGKSVAQVALSRGQYSHPKGLFFGGHSETWSNKTLRSIVHQYLSDTHRIIVVDVHTGLGDYGHAEVILNVPENSDEYRRAVDIWGESRVKTTVTGESVSAHLDSSFKLALSEMLPQTEVTPVSLEFGTFPPLTVFKALRAENWLHHYGNSDSAHTTQIKSCLLRAFYPDDPDWRESVGSKGKEIIDLAIAHLISKTRNGH